MKTKSKLVFGAAFATVSLFASASFALGFELQAGEYLSPNQCVSDGAFQLCYQGDGNLVIYHVTDNGWVARWSTGTPGYSPGVAVMQGDGNFVLYTPSWEPYWASNTPGHTTGKLEFYDTYHGGAYIMVSTPELAWYQWAPN